MVQATSRCTGINSKAVTPASTSMLFFRPAGGAASSVCHRRNHRYAVRVLSVTQASNLRQRKGGRDRLAAARLHLRRPAAAPAGGLDVLAVEELTRALHRAVRSLVERAVGAGLARCCTFGALRILDVVHGLGLGRGHGQERLARVRLAQRTKGDGCERYPERQAPEQLAAGQILRW